MVFAFFLTCQGFFVSLGYTRPFAQKSPVARPIVRLLSRVHPARSVPCQFIALVLPTKHLFDQHGP